MLRAKAIPPVLEQAMGSGVKGALLFNQEGALMAQKSDRSVDEKLFAAIVANVWKSIGTTGDSLDAPQKLSFFLAEFQNARVAVGSVSELLLCLVAEPTAELGLLRAKLSTLREAFEQPFSEIIAPGGL